MRELFPKILGIKVIHPFVSISIYPERIQAEHRLLVPGSLGEFGLAVGKGHQTVEVAVGLIEPVVFFVRRDVL